MKARAANGQCCCACGCTNVVGVGNLTEMMCRKCYTEEHHDMIYSVYLQREAVLRQQGRPRLKVPPPIPQGGVCAEGPLLKATPEGPPLGGQWPVAVAAVEEEPPPPRNACSTRAHTPLHVAPRLGDVY